eukprot:403333276
MERQKLESNLKQISQHIQEMQQQSQLEIDAQNSIERPQNQVALESSRKYQIQQKYNQMQGGGSISQCENVQNDGGLADAQRQGFNGTMTGNQQRRRKKRNREISMSDVMPKFENTQSMLETTNPMKNYTSTVYNTLYGAGVNHQKMNFVTFIRIYPSIEEFSFIGFFTAIDVMTIRLLCRDCAIVFNEDLQYNRTRDPITGKIVSQGDSKKLFHILQTIAFLLPDMAYCQGMNFIAAVLYTYLKDEELTFDIFLSLLAQKELKPLYINGVPEYHLRNFMLDQLIKQHLPDLFYHFRRLDLKIEVITGQWLMTFFCGYFNYESILMIIDNFFIDDWLAIFRISLALLNMFKDEILSLNDIAYVASFFQQLKEKTETIPILELLYDSLQFNINDDHLDILESQYFVEQAQKKLREDPSKWDQSESQFLNQITNFVKKSEPALRKEISNLQKKLIMVDHDLKKQVQIASMSKMEYEQAQEIKDHIFEKKNILYVTYTTLKRDIHTRKQTHKMTILAQILKKRRDQTMSASVDYNGITEEDQEPDEREFQDAYSQNQPKPKDDWNYQSHIVIEKVENIPPPKQNNRPLNTEAFDPKKNAKEIKELEMDVQRIEHRMKENEYMCNMYEGTFLEKRQIYDHEKIKNDALQEMKDKVMQQINGMMMAFEASKMQKIQFYAEYLREKYRDMYKIEF